MTVEKPDSIDCLSCSTKAKFRIFSVCCRFKFYQYLEQNLFFYQANKLCTFKKKIIRNQVLIRYTSGDLEGNFLFKSFLFWNYEEHLLSLDFLLHFDFWGALKL